MKKLTAIAITLTAIGVAVRVTRNKKNDQKISSIHLGDVDSYPDWVRELIYINR